MSSSEKPCLHCALVEAYDQWVNTCNDLGEPPTMFEAGQHVGGFIEAALAPHEEDQVAKDAFGQGLKSGAAGMKKMVQEQRRAEAH